ncbi:hypothetical protein MtrunA17_Chr4g0023971 [Medicago truncatula]|uniref:Uncharacterized protein n=1 Tax=Medicago truncatula TaxID=3880 RepID=A0A396I3R0_MEDTR|nr:hypothetical protein MtrunA17_Chr4g0023971 [Medicago truncatula]
MKAVTVPAESPSTSLSWIDTLPNIYLLLDTKPAPEFIKFEFKEISIMEKMVKSPTWLEEFIKLGRGRQRHT